MTSTEYMRRFKFLVWSLKGRKPTESELEIALEHWMLGLGFIDAIESLRA